MIDQGTARPRAIVTGASSGIGEAFAERLARDGYALTVVARRQDRLQALAERLGRAHGRSVETVAADLTQSADLRAVEQRVAEDPALALLINNAGFGSHLAFAEADPDQAEDMIRLHVTAVTRLTRAALPGMIARRRGGVINVASRLAFSAALPSPPLPRRAVYAATKAYVNVFTQVLAGELAETGVRVQSLCPGIVRTEFHARMPPRQLPDSLVMQAADLVNASLTGLERGEVICVPALGDVRLLRDLDEAHRQLLEGSDTGTVASRYGPRP